MITQKNIVKFRLKNLLRRMSFFKRNRNKVRPSKVTLLKSQDTKQRLGMTLKLPTSLITPQNLTNI